MLQVILVRHGETDWNKEHRVQGGKTDTQLNDTGRKQAEAVALRLKPETFRAIYSSPLQRARDTAQAIARYHQLEVEIAPELRELDVGDLEGVQVGSIGKLLDKLLVSRGQDGSMVKAGEGLFSEIEQFGGESLTELQQRAWSTLQKIAGQHSDGTIAVVSHYFIILAIILNVIGLPMSRIGSFRLGVGSVSSVILDGAATRLTLFSDICHQTA
ncbi:histidine phosphatase family protein [Chloroflexota bacterium]